MTVPQPLPTKEHMVGTDTGNGKIVQVIGPVVDVEFPPGKLPNIFNALTISQGSGETGDQLTMEVRNILVKTVCERCPCLPPTGWFGAWK